MKGDFTRFTFEPTKHYTGVLEQQGKVALDAGSNENIEIQQHLERTTNKDVIGPCGAPETDGGFEIGVTDDGRDLTISPGHIYVDGILCELEDEGTSYLNQPDYPNPEKIAPEEGRTDLVCLDVWQRHITAIEDPDIREVALGGPDTTTRLKTVWQVKVLPGKLGVHPTCEDAFPRWDETTAPSGGRLSTEVVPTPPSEDPCSIVPGGGYRGLENRLYRVEIHEGGDLGKATFKWSRDNGAVVSAIEKFVGGEPKQVRVKRLGRDQVLALHVGDWVEVLGDEKELRGEPGTLAQILDIDEADRKLTLSKKVSSHEGESHPKVRRWDHKETSAVALKDGAVPVQEGEWLELEDGIRIRFKPGGTYKPGDYWVFAARTATTSEGEPFIEQLVDAPPRGIEHHYCRLALVTWNWERMRRLVTWNEEEDRADPDLAKDWSSSDDGLTWTFYLVQGVTMPDGDPFNAEETYKILLDNSDRLTGLDTCEVVDDYSVTVVLEDRNPEFLKELSEIPILVAAEEPVVQVEDCRKLFPPLTNITADDVSFDDTVCKMSAETVQEAIDELCQIGGEPGMHVTKISLNTGHVLKNDSEVSVSKLEDGLRVECNEDIDPATISQPTCFVILDMPFPFNPADRELWGNDVIGYRPLILAADVSSHNSSIVWHPTPATESWLKSVFKCFQDLKIPVDRVLAHLTLKGNFIRATDDPRLYLDGEAFGTPKGKAASNLFLPSGDGRRGGDFEMWFWVVAEIDRITAIVDLNTATLSELEALRGIGPELARAIVDRRHSRLFDTVDELLEVPGIGPNVLEQLRDLITV